MTRKLLRKTSLVFVLLWFFSCSKESPEIVKLKQVAFEKTTQGDITGAIETYHQILKLTPNDTPSINNLGQLYTYIQMNEQAEKAFLRAKELDGHNPAVLNNLGALYYQMGKVQEAEKMLDQALALDPEQSKTLFMLGTVAADRKELQKALDYFNKAIRYDPEFKEAFLSKGFAHVELGELDKAEKTWNQLYLRDPLFGPVILQLAFLYHKQKKVEQEEELLKKSIELGIDFPPLSLHYATLLDLSGRSEEAIKVLKLATNSLTKDPMVHFSLGFLVLDHQNNIQEAERYFHEAFRINRAYKALFLDGKAWSAAKKENFSLAKQYFQQADLLIGKLPIDLQALHYYYYGRYFMLMRDLKKAEESFNKVKILDPTGRWTGKANYELTKLHEKG